MKQTLLLLIFAAFITLTARGQDSVKISYIPEVFGAVKAKLEFSTYDGEHRFNVRNSRIGVKGLVSPHMRYAIQIDFNNEGKLSILDSYAAFSYNRFEITIGQQQYKFNSDLDLGPSTNMFSNRSMLAKFITTYYGSEIASQKQTHYVNSIGSRDIGALATYKIKSKLPIKLTLGAFNGAGTNNPEWSSNINIIARADVGTSQGFAGAISHYNGRMPQVSRYIAATGANEAKLINYHQEIRMWGAELRYTKEPFQIEAQYAQRRLLDTQLNIMHAALVQGYYKFELGKKSFTDYICPLARWDMGNGIEYINSQSKMRDTFSANRATIGVNFGFITKLLSSELRLHYEKYMFNNQPSDLSVNKLLQDKFTIEIVASF